MIVLAEPDPDDMVQAIAKAIYILPQINPQDMHLRVSDFFFIYLIHLSFENISLKLSLYLPVFCSDEKTVQLA